MAQISHWPGWGGVRWIERKLGQMPVPRQAHRIFKLAHVVDLPTDQRYLTSFLTCFTEAQKETLLAPDIWQYLSQNGITPANILRQHYDRYPTLQGLERRQYGDLKHTLVSEMLTKVDSMTMAASLEARPPLLDYQLVEFAARLPPHLKVRHNSGKYLLKRYAETCLPHDLVHRPKHGFDVPLNDWFRGELRPLAHEVLFSKKARDRGMFESQPVFDLLDRHERGLGNFGAHIYVMLILELWCQANLDT